MTTVYSLYHGYDHYGENVNRHLGTFSTKEEAISKGTKMLANIKSNNEVFFIEHVLGSLYPDGTDDDNSLSIHSLTYRHSISSN